MTKPPTDEKNYVKIYLYRILISLRTLRTLKMLNKKQEKGVIFWLQIQQEKFFLL